MKKLALILLFTLCINLVSIEGQNTSQIAPHNSSTVDEKTDEINPTPTSQKILLIVLTVGGMVFIWLAYRQSKWRKKK